MQKQSLSLGQIQLLQPQQGDKLKDVVLHILSSSQHPIVLWSEVSFTQLLSLSNKVYRASYKDHSILIKIYHSTLQQFSDKELQTRLVRELSNRQMYPELLFACSAFRMQRFVDSVEINRFSLGEEKVLQIVRQMAEYSCGFRQFVSDYNKQHKAKLEFNALPRLFRQIYAEKIQECPQLVQKCDASLALVFNNEGVMQRFCDILNATELVLSHNDCHLGNILVSTSKIYLLDFEFSQFNHIGFDLGNFINEWATVYGTAFDSSEEMEEGLKQRVIEVYFGTLQGGYSFRGRECWQWYTQVGRVLSHLFWMLIGLKQINDPQIEFDMVEYVRGRQVEFTRHYQILIGMKGE